MRLSHRTGQGGLEVKGRFRRPRPRSATCQLPGRAAVPIRELCRRQCHDWNPLGVKVHGH